MAHEKFLIGSLTPFGQTMEVTSSQKVLVGTVEFRVVSPSPLSSKRPPVGLRQGGGGYDSVGSSAQAGQPGPSSGLESSL